MPITTDFNVFEQNYKKKKIKTFWRSTLPLQNFETPSSLTKTSPPPSPKKQPEKIMHNFKKNIWRKNLLYLINLHFKKGDIFTTPQVYEKCEDVLQKVYPKSKTIKASILANLQYLRDEKYIKFISLGKYILL